MWVCIGYPERCIYQQHRYHHPSWFGNLFYSHYGPYGVESSEVGNLAESCRSKLDMPSIAMQDYLSFNYYFICV